MLAWLASEKEMGKDVKEDLKAHTMGPCPWWTHWDRKGRQSKKPWTKLSTWRQFQGNGWKTYSGVPLGWGIEGKQSIQSHRAVLPLDKSMAKAHSKLKRRFWIWLGLG